VPIVLSEIDFTGSDLHRPECVLVTRSGEIYATDRECGFCLLGSPKRPLSNAPDGFFPNGIALLRDRTFLVASLTGGVWRVNRQGEVAPFLLDADGVPISVANFVGLDRAGRTWVSVSTSLTPQERAFNANTRDGFIVLIEDGVGRIVADGIAFANECRVDPTSSWLYVNETFGRRLSRFPLHDTSGLIRTGTKEVVHEFNDGDFPDGLAFDAEGGVWVACAISNRVIRIGLDGSREVIVEDPDSELNSRADAAWAAGQLGRSDIDAGSTRLLRNVSSVAFGGRDLHTVYLGSLAGDRLAKFHSPIAGAPPPHWDY
jgi:sugar lactone lactonase YvrE